MSASISLVIFCALATLSLTAVSLINQREKRRQLQRQRLRQVRFRIQELEELVLAMEQLVESRIIAKLLNDEILEMVTQQRQAHPEANYLDASLQAAFARSELLSNESEPVALDRLKDSDLQIAKSKRMLQEAGAILRRQQTRGKISLEELNDFLSHLSWAHLMVDVISHVGQGHKAVRRFDALTAHAFYRKAQQQLMQSTHSDKRRHRFIKELSEIMNNTRRTISLDLMPENQLNATRDQDESSTGTAINIENSSQEILDQLTEFTHEIH